VFPAGSSTIRRPPFLHGVPAGQVPPLQRYCEGATTSRCPSRLVSFPSLGDTIYGLRPCILCACRPRDVVAYGWGLVIRPPYRHLKAWRQRDLPSSWATLLRICHALGPRRDLRVRSLLRFGAVHATLTAKTPAFLLLSRLNRTAFAIAVYASRPESPLTMQDSLLAADQALPDWIGYQQGRAERFQSVNLLLSQVCLGAITSS
jgi:hypothetical protein